VPFELLLLQDEVVGYFSRYAQAMLKKIWNGSVSPGINGSAVDSPEHDCLSWLNPPGQLEGPNRNCTRPLQCVVKKAVEKCAGNIDSVASGWKSKRRVVKAALRKGLRTRCNRRRTSARLLPYRTLGVYMDNHVKEVSMERVVIATEAQSASEAAELSTLATPGNVSYRLKVKDGAREMERALDLKMGLRRPSLLSCFFWTLQKCGPLFELVERPACRSTWMLWIFPNSCVLRAPRLARALFAACGTS